MDPPHGIASAFDRRSALPLIRGLARLHDSMVLVDDLGRVVWMSDGLASMCGEPERFRGRCWIEMLSIQEEGERLAETLSQVGYLANESIALHGPRGESIPVKLCASRLGDAGASWATITVVRPETHATDRPLPDSPECMRAILDSSPDGVVVVDRGRVVFDFGDVADLSYVASVRKSVLCAPRSIHSRLEYRSICQPMSCDASRTFCPFLPIASES